ncbi:MAG: cellulose synthase family protein [Bacteroidota bacterium]
MFTEILEYTVLTIYVICLGLIVVYSLMQLHLIIVFLKRRKKVSQLAPLSEVDDHPFVTVQLPIYNELYVVERLLDAVAAMDYPKDRFEIQLLDDSDDETLEVAASKIAELQARGIQAIHLRRPERGGFKAGALAYGLEHAKGEFIAVFDADFIPNPNFLKATIPHFEETEIGVVQARWEHINQDYSMLTEALAFHLDAHFTIEQFGRNAGGFYMNFNGTAGVWRKTCIEDAGGWEYDTLTEDLDLSYRAQLKGWKFRYVDEIGAPAELPAEMGAIKSQQYRWMKGGAEVARKMLKTLWKSDNSLLKKLHGSAHLLSSSVFLLVLGLGATSVPLLYIKHEIFGGNIQFLLIPVILLFMSFLVLATMYMITFRWREPTFKAALRRFTKYYIPFLALTMGLSLHNSIAVIQGFWGKRTPFIRTPKFNLTDKKDSWKANKYINKKVKPSVYAELGLFLYFCFGCLLAIYFWDLSILPFMLMQAFGFGVVGINSFIHAAK